MNELQIDESLYNIKALVDDYTAKANEIVQLKYEVLHLKTLLAYAILRNGGSIKGHGEDVPNNLASAIQSRDVELFMSRKETNIMFKGIIITDVAEFTKLLKQDEQTP